MGRLQIWVLVCLLLSSLSQAADQLPGNKVFLIDENPQGQNINLLAWLQFNQKPPTPSQPYVREHHFGVWVDFKGDESCLNTRAMVLVRDSSTQPKMSPSNPCVVASGTWFDPYTNRNYTQANQVEIDHVVPLKNAYISGAYKWPWRMRCSYFNYVGNRFHLMPVESSTNRNKSDKSVEEWLPPNRKFHCEYVANWLRIKAIWRLMMSEQEVQGVFGIINGAGCDKQMFTMPAAELGRQRKIATDIGNACPANPPEFN